MKNSQCLMGFCLCLFFGVASAADTLKPRIAEVQRPYEVLQSPSNTTQVVVKFTRGFELSLDQSNQVSGLPDTEQDLFAKTLGFYNAELQAMFSASAKDLRALTASAQEHSDHELTDLTLYFLAELKDAEQSANLAQALGELKFVEFAHPVRRPEPPNQVLTPQPHRRFAFDIPPTTNDLSPLQGYKDSAPHGIHLPKSGGLKNVSGEGVRIVDVEQGWILDHEDLGMGMRDILAPADFVEFVPWFYDSSGQTDSGVVHHGTAALGVMGAVKNGYGMTGIAHRAEYRVSPELYLIAPYSATTYIDNMRFNRYDAIMRAITYLGHGDILVLEMQTNGCSEEADKDEIKVPAEWDRVVYDLTQIATAEGIVVVAAAGNGSQNLAAPECEHRFGPHYTDSGAIIVGASHSTTRVRMDFSNYGPRVDLHAWGENVATLGYDRNGIAPDSLSSNEIQQFYTEDFSGTSSATPIVAGAAAVIQSRHKYCQRRPLNSRQMRDLLIKNGTPQSHPLPFTFEHIGPQPNVIKALNAAEIIDFCLNLTDSPSTVSLSQSRGSIGFTHTVTVENRTAQAVRIRRALRNSPLSPYLTLASSGTRIPPNGSLDIEVTLLPRSQYNVPLGYHSIELVIRKRNSGYEPYVYQIPIRVTQ